MSFADWPGAAIVVVVTVAHRTILAAKPTRTESRAVFRLTKTRKSMIGGHQYHRAAKLSWLVQWGRQGHRERLP